MALPRKEQRPTVMGFLHWTVYSYSAEKSILNFQNNKNSFYVLAEEPNMVAMVAHGNAMSVASAAVLVWVWVA